MKIAKAVSSSNAPSGTTTTAPPPSGTTGTGTVGVISGGVPVTGLKGLRASLSAMAQGWSTVIPMGSVLPSNGGGYSQATILSQLNGWLANYAAGDLARTTYTAAVATIDAQIPDIRAELAQLKLALKAYFGSSSPQLAQFGIKPAKAKAKLSGIAMAARAARATQTRAIRGTKSKKQAAQLGKAGPVTVTVTAAAPSARSVALAAASQATSEPTGQPAASPAPTKS